MNIPRLPSIPKKVLFPIIGVILVSGVSVAALKAPTMDDTKPLKQTQIAQAGTAVAEPSQSVTTETPTETAPATSSSSEQNTNLGETTTEPSAPTAFDNFHDLITNQAQALAAIFVPAFAPDTASFIRYQTYCLERGYDASTPQDLLDARASFLVPQDNGDGRMNYQFFDGGCRVIQLKR